MSRVIAAAPMANPEAMVVLTAGGGFIDDSMTGFADALAAAFDSAPHIARHFEKLKERPCAESDHGGRKLPSELR